MVILLLAATFVLAMLESEEWHCYNDGDTCIAGHQYVRCDGALYLCGF